jgi:hypothetical protein
LEFRIVGAGSGEIAAENKPAQIPFLNRLQAALAPTAETIVYRSFRCFPFPASGPSNPSVVQIDDVES